MNNKTIFYFHGFNSASQDAEGNILNKSKLNFISSQCEKYGISFEAPNLDFTHFKDSMNDIEKRIAILLNAGAKVLVMGTSMGGFVSEYFRNQFNIPAILMNPAIDPTKSLQVYIKTPAVQLEHYVTHEKYDWTIEHCQVFEKYLVPEKVSKLSAPRVVMLDMGDKVIDSTKTATLYSNNSQVITFEGGEHRFTHIEQTWPVIEEILKL